MAKKKDATVPAKLTEAEQDLIWHMEHAYQLETDSLGGNPVLRRLKDDEVVRPGVRESQYREGTRRARPDRSGQGCNPLKIEWHLDKPKK
jgi:hypothetical protein